MTSDGVQARAPALAMEIALPGTTYMKQPGDRPPWVRLVAQIGCGQVGEDPDWPAIRAAFTSFLQGPAVVELLADLTHAGQCAVWPRQATSTSSIIAMVLGDGVASARLELPDGIRRHGRVEGYALLILHAGPHAADGTSRATGEPVVVAAALRAGRPATRCLRGAEAAGRPPDGWSSAALIQASHPAKKALQA